MCLFPPHLDSRLEFSFLLNSCLDIVKIRQDQMSVDQNLGLLHAVDERLAAYCWLTNTGVKLLVVVDMAGRSADFSGAGTDKKKGTPVVGLRDSDLKPVCLEGYMSFAIRRGIYSYLLGIPSFADCLHPAPTKPLLRPGRTLSSGDCDDVEIGPIENHGQEIYCGS